MGLPDHNPFVWQILKVVAEFSSYPLPLLQTKHALEPVALPL